MVTSDTFQTSLWMCTAVSPPETKTLTELLDTQVVVVGAGFTVYLQRCICGNWVARWLYWKQKRLVLVPQDVMVVK